MQMQQIRYFLALCEERSFTRAAKRCGVSQPSLTNAIIRLEQKLGGALFRRWANCADAVNFENGITLASPRGSRSPRHTVPCASG